MRSTDLTCRSRTAAASAPARSTAPSTRSSCPPSGTARCCCTRTATGSPQPGAAGLRPGRRPTPRSPPPTPTAPDRTRVSKKLLAEGYALAGSSYKTNGWAVGRRGQGRRAAARQFVHARRHAQADLRLGRLAGWADHRGAGRARPVLGRRCGADVRCAWPARTYNFDIALDVAFAVKTLIDPQLKLTGYASADEAADNWKQAPPRWRRPPPTPPAAARPRCCSSPRWSTRRSQSRDLRRHRPVTSQVKARVESLLTALAFGTSGRYELEQRVGGDPSDNTKADYDSRIDRLARRPLIALAGGNADQLEKPSWTPAPRISGRRRRRGPRSTSSATPPATLAVPTVTMHTEDDPLVLVQNETVFAGRATAKRQDRHGWCSSTSRRRPATPRPPGRRTGPATATSPTASGSA